MTDNGRKLSRAPPIVQARPPWPAFGVGQQSSTQPSGVCCSPYLNPVRQHSVGWLHYGGEAAGDSQRPNSASKVSRGVPEAGILRHW